MRLLIAACLLAASLAHASVFRVTTTADSGAGSLRQAVAGANANPGDDWIEFDAALTTAGPATIAISSTSLKVNGNAGWVVISGPGADRLTLDASGAGAGFDVASGGLLQINELTIANAKGTASGHGIYSRGHVQIVDSAVRDCKAGILVDKSVEVVRSTLSNNEIGIDTGYHPLTITVNGSVITGNSSWGIQARCSGSVAVYDSRIDHNGGGIFAEYFPSVTIQRCQISDNAWEGVRANIAGETLVYIDYSTISGNGGPGVACLTHLTLRNCTIHGNSSPTSYAGAIFAWAESYDYNNVEVVNCTITGNYAPPGKAAGFRCEGYFGAIMPHIFNNVFANNVDANGSEIEMIGRLYLAWNWQNPDVHIQNNLIGPGGLKLPSSDEGWFSTDSIKPASVPGADPYGNYYVSSISQAGLEPAGLQNNGGSYKTVALLPSSPAKNAGNNGRLYGLTTDQRGAPRILGGTVDMGAYESPTAPEITTPTVNGVASTAAILGGNVTSDGGALDFRRGVLVARTSVNGNPTLGGTGVTEFATSGGMGVFTVRASALMADTDYSFVAFATSGFGTSYTTVRTFRTTSIPIFVVNNLNDEVNAADGLTSLREAVVSAMVEPGNQTITFDPGVFSSAKTIQMTSGAFAFSGEETETLTIQGPGADRLTFDAAEASRLFDMSQGTLAVSGVRLIRGKADSGGAVRVTGGSLQMTDCELTGNLANNGGGIAVTDGNVTLTRCRITGNNANYTGEGNIGGGVHNKGGTVLLDRCTVSGNYAPYCGGGIYAGDWSVKKGVTTLKGCTLSDNSSAYGGAILGALAPVSLENCTVSGNQAAQGGGCYSSSASWTLSHCTISLNRASSGEGGGLFGGGFTLANTVVAGQIASTNVHGGHLDAAPNFVGGNPHLGSLQDNGGPTLTMAPLPGSPLINGGTTLAGLATDQRGMTRVVGIAPDIGAAEDSVGNSDPDGDGLTNAQEYVLGTNATALDTDGDGFSDITEQLAGTDPVSPASTPGATYFGRVFGSGAARGLDLSGNFVYALNIGTGGAAGQAGDANFTADHVAGATVSAPNEISNWLTREFGSSAADNALETVCRSIRWGTPGQPVTVQLANIIPGRRYKLQLLFAEDSSPDRAFDVLVNGSLVVDNFCTAVAQGGAPSASAASVVTHEFVSSNSTVDIVLSGDDVPESLHRNPILNGLTLEEVTAAAAAPFITPAGGTHASGAFITLSTSAADAQIRYTTDGSTPSDTHGALYGAPFALTGNMTVRAIAFGNGWLPSSVSSAVFTLSETPGLVVNLTTDTMDVLDGKTSLREAIAYAHAKTGADIITFDPVVFGTAKTISLQASAGALILSNSGLDNALTIQGPGSGALTVSGGGATRVLDLGGGAVEVSGLRIHGGRAERGAGVRVTGGSLFIHDCVISGNVANSGGGVAVLEGGAILTRCRIQDNTVNYTGGVDAGGGLENQGGTVVMDQCTVSGNYAPYGGGAVFCGDYSAGRGNTTLTGCTLSDNWSTFGGALFVVRAQASLTNCTLSGNEAGGKGGAAYGHAAPSIKLTHCTVSANKAGGLFGVSYTLVNTILAGQQSGADMDGYYTDGGNNFIGGNPLLGPLQDNGGETFTMAPLPGSPVLNGGVSLPEIGADQRGHARTVGSAPDIGAYEDAVGNDDQDGDGLTNAQEAALGTHFGSLDSDGDGYNDATEVLSGSDPLTGTSKPSETHTERVLGSGPGQGLDLQGDFLYAVNVGTTGAAGQAGDAAFTGDDVTGVTASAAFEVAEFATFDFGTSAEAGTLEKVFNSLRSGGPGEPVKVSLANLTPGRRYKLQLLFGENGVQDRRFDVLINDHVIANDFSPAAAQGGSASRSTASAIVHEFVAAIPTMNVVISGDDVLASGHPLPILNGLTLEDLSSTHEAPVITPGGGTHVGSVQVTLSTTASGATMRYTTDGSKPTATHGTVYTGAFTLTNSVKVQAVTLGVGTSPVSEADFVVAEAPSLVVNLTTDTVDAFDKKTSLREAISYALSQWGADTITFDPSVFNTARTITLTTFPYNLSNAGEDNAVTIQGPGADLLTLHGGGIYRLFDLAGGVATINGLRVSGGKTDGGGGLLIMGGSLRMSDCQIKGNFANRGGGMLITDGSATLTRCRIEDNRVDHTDGYNSGGGVENYGGTLVLDRCTLSGNYAPYGGGAIFAGNFGFSRGSTTLTACTLNNNWASFGGGLFGSLATVSLTNCTLAVNEAGGQGGASYNYGSTIRLTHCTVSGNKNGGLVPGGHSLANSIVARQITGSNIEGGYTDEGHNFIGGDPLLGPLQNNGGPTLTMAPLLGSPVIDGGASLPDVPTDQRGNTRLYGSAPDIGALEINEPFIPEIAVELSGGAVSDGAGSLAFGSMNIGGASAAKTVTVRNLGNTPLAFGAVTVTGAHAADFTVDTSGMGTVVPAGGSTGFSVIFTPVTAGVRKAAIQMASDDADENPFDIQVSGTGVSDVVKPAVTISSPLAGALILTNDAMTVTGTASDIWGIAQVTVSLDGGAPQDAILVLTNGGKNATYNLSLPTPSDGAHTLSVVARDTSGNVSATLKRVITVSRRALLTLTRTVPAGLTAVPDLAGSVSLLATPSTAASAFTPATANSNPKISKVIPGTPVKLTATAKAGYAFSHWSSLPAGAVALGNVATFAMPAHDTAIGAVFVVNPFAAAAGTGGTFYGLIHPEAGTTSSNDTEGFFTGTLTTTSGAFSGKVLIGGVIQSIVGTFYGNGSFVFAVGTSKQTALTFGGRTLALTYNAGTGNNQISATITQGANSSSGVARRIISPPASLLSGGGKPGLLTLGLPFKTQSPARDATTYPQGDGFGTLSVASTGLVALSGTLADGTVFTAASALVGGNECPVFAQLVTPGAAATVKGGSFGGLLTFDTAKTHSDVSGSDLRWFRPAVTEVAGTTANALATQRYTAGWPGGITVDAVGAFYDKTINVQTALGLGAANVSTGNGELMFTGGKLTAPVNVTAFNVEPAAAAGSSKVTKIPVANSSFTLTVAQSTGTFNGSFTPNWNAQATAKPAFKGVLIQKGDSKGGFGYFISNAVGDTHQEVGAVTLSDRP